jgi:beta-lactamase regulating signal transducer with metallopeptidase domain
VIAVWMLYCMGIGLAFVVVGHALEKGLHFAGRPTRWAWVVALVGSYLVPVAAWIRPDAFATFAAPIPMLAESAPSSSVATASTTSTILHQPPSQWLSLTDLDVPLRWGWGAGSVLMLLALGIAATRLAAARRRWRQEAIDGRVVLVSRNVGPAMVGVWSPRVVLPEWALGLPASDRELMLAHEEQHLRAADPALLACGFVLVLLAPWNLALWWQWRRLRLAVEMDCDARVLAEGRSAPAYGELLLHVGQRRSTQLVGTAAFGEPASFLESRIRRMVTGMPRWRWAGAFVALVVAVGALVGACEAPRPVGPPGQTIEPEVASSAGITGVVTSVIEPAAIDQAPVVLSGATAPFPDLTRLAGIEGRVVVQARIETNGRADSGSVTVLQSPHPALAQVAKSAVLRSLFRPAQSKGRAVGAVAHVVYDFMTTRSVAQPLDSARAIAVAVDKLCGGQFALTDGTCFVRGYQRTSDRHLMILDRRPPAGNDRLRVELSGTSDNVWLKAGPFGRW